MSSFIALEENQNDSGIFSPGLVTGIGSFAADLINSCIGVLGILGWLMLLFGFIVMFQGILVLFI